MTDSIIFIIFLILILVIFICSILYEILHDRKLKKQLHVGSVLQNTLQIDEFTKHTFTITIISLGKYYAKIKYSDNSISIIPIRTLIEENWKIIN